MKKILILGAKGDLARAIIKNIDKIKFKIFKIDKKDINFLNSNSQKKLFFLLKKIKPDIIINCIGFFDTNVGDFDKIIKSNIYPTWLLIKYYIKKIESDVKIISIGSSSFDKPRKNYILYAASKSALNNIQISSRDLFSGSKIKFHVINPPSMNSKMRKKSLKLLKIKHEKKNKLLESTENIAKQIIKKVHL